MLAQILLGIYSEFCNRQVLFLASVCFLGAVYKLVVFPFFISPLRHIPGPYLHRISYVPSLNAQRTFRLGKKIHRLHEKYGDIVLLSPTSIAFNGPKHVTDIYVKNMPKSTYYEHFKFHGEVNMFAELSNEKHLSYKRMVQGLYSKSAVFSPKNTTRQSIVERVQELVQQVYLTSVSGQFPDTAHAASELNRHGKGYKLGHGNWLNTDKKTSLGIDVHSLFASLAMDVVSAFELGPSNGTHLLQNPHHRSIVPLHRMVSEMVFWTTQMPYFWSWAAGATVRAAAQDIEKWQLNLYERAEANPEKNGRNLCTLETLKKHGLAGSRAYSNVSDNLVAGHDTTATHLTYMCYELSRPVNSEKQKRLQDELRRAFGPPGSLEACISDLEHVDSLPYLEALVQENLRVHASTPGHQPRVTEKVYNVAIGKKQVAVPPGTVVSCQPYSMHRVAEVFPEPEKWEPERWMQKSGESRDQHSARLQAMQRYMVPFGRGVRMCIGMNIALVEIKLAVANLYWRYGSALCADWCDVTARDNAGVVRMGGVYAGGTSDESMMTKVDSYITRPYYDECWLEWCSY